MLPYTLAVTSCNRHDLLEATLRSFTVCADQPPRYTVILEDGTANAPAWLPSLPLGQVTWLKNDARMGQVYSIDRLWKEIKTEYVFWLEDDWRFTESGFLEPSVAILDAHADIYTVCLRTDQNHPKTAHPANPSLSILEPYWRGTWGGCTWNPGLRRLRDYKAHGPAGRFAARGEHGLGHEARLSKHNLDAGFKIASLPRYCHHIGGGRSRAVEKLDSLPNILIAVPACDSFEYGKWESAESPYFNPSIAYNGQPYGTDIHISGKNPRIAAVRETWWRDIERYPNVIGRFFYGKNDGGRPTREDEVFLGVPNDYAHLPHKTIAICKWALEHGFDYVLKVDDDTAVNVYRAINEVIEYRPDYAGYQNGNVCTGGPGYWLSRAAMKAVQDNPNTWCEDVWVAKCMDIAGITPAMLTGHKSGRSNHWVDITQLPPDTVTAHAVKPEDMRSWYARL